MDRKKLNKAAENHAKAMGDVPAINSTHAFKAGADWLMQQPLSERLTEEEKDIYRNMYQSLSENIRANKCAGFPDLACWDEAKQEIFVLIFGTDLFTEK